MSRVQIQACCGDSTPSLGVWDTGLENAGGTGGEGTVSGMWWLHRCVYAEKGLINVGRRVQNVLALTPK